jgi:hypothetical protein
MAEETRHVRLTRKACKIYTIYTPARMNQIQHVPKRRRKSQVSTGHSGTGKRRVVVCTGLGQWQKSRSTIQGANLSFSAKYQRNSSTRISQKMRLKGQLLLLLNLDIAVGFQNQTIAKKMKYRIKNKK